MIQAQQRQQCEMIGCCRSLEVNETNQIVAMKAARNPLWLFMSQEVQIAEISIQLQGPASLAELVSRVGDLKFCVFYCTELLMFARSSLCLVKVLRLFGVAFSLKDSLGKIPIWAPGVKWSIDCEESSALQLALSLKATHVEPLESESDVKKATC